MTMGFDIQFADHGHVCELIVSGEVDLSVADDLATAGLACLTGTAKVLEIDFGEVTFIDSTGIGALIAIRNRAVLTGKTLLLRSVPDRVRKVLRIAGLAEIFGLDATEAAVRELSPAPVAATEVIGLG
jgi:anti-sigma B factor antagonist